MDSLTDLSYNEVSNMKINILFINSEQETDSLTNIISIPQTVDSKLNLLEFFSKKMNFPDYFGYNWDSFYDTLLDDSWINKNEINLLHPQLPLLPPEDLKIYFEIINDLVKNNDNSVKILRFVFYQKDQLEIERYFRN